MSNKRSLSRRKFFSSTLKGVVVTGITGTLASGSFLPSNESTALSKGLPGIIKGTVLGGSDIYIPSSQVQLLNVSTKKVSTITSNLGGEFEFKDLRAGNYELTVPSMDGFAPVSVNLSEGAVVDITLRIKKLVISKAFTKPGPVTVADLKGMETKGVSVIEVSDYIFGNYQGELKCPPNADGNPKKAFIIFWKDFSHRFIFSHESSYCPMMEMPSGSAVCYQFFEGNEGRAELWNTPGRRERNSFVEIIEPGPDRVWVRWTYFGVNQDTGEQYYRATEDFWAYPNGIIVRRQTYTSLVPGIHGHAREPIEIIAMFPVGKMWVDVLEKDENTGEHHPLVVLDAFSKNRYDVFWKHTPGTISEAIPRRSGASWKELDDSAGVVLVIPMKEGSPFCVFGDASGFRHDFTRIKEHSHIDTGGIGWNSRSWDQWPVGWLNSQDHPVDKDSFGKYPNYVAPAGMDFFALPNEEAEKGVYYSLIGVGGDNMEEIRSLANTWLTKGEDAITSSNMNSGADLPTLRY